MCIIAEGLFLDSFSSVDAPSGFLEIVLGVFMNQTSYCWLLSENMRFLVLDILLNLILFANSALINDHCV
jgi:hypothetical protein